MKRWVLVFGGVACAILAVWAYTTAGKTRMALSELRMIENEIAKEREHIEILRAEWAILNRPERLRFLVEQNASMLSLRQIHAENYGLSTQVPYRSQSAEADDFIGADDIEAILQDLINSGEIEPQ